MTTREKIIVGVMCLTIVYGAYEVIGRSGSRPDAPPTVAGSSIGELKSFVAEISGKLANERISQNHQHMIHQAGADWTKDPFIHSTEPLKKRLTPNASVKKQVRKRPSPAYVYSGFMQLGRIRLAIINGMEYAVGEKLPDTSFYVKSISSKRVVIGKVNGSETIQVFITETDASSGI